MCVYGARNGAKNLPRREKGNDISLARYEIRLRRMIYRALHVAPHGMIYLRAANIFSIRRRRISSHAVRYHPEGISSVPEGTDIIAKRKTRQDSEPNSRLFSKSFLFLAANLRLRFAHRSGSPWDKQQQPRAVARGCFQKKQRYGKCLLLAPDRDSKRKRKAFAIKFAAQTCPAPPKASRFFRVG